MIDENDYPKLSKQLINKVNNATPIIRRMNGTYNLVEVAAKSGKLTVRLEVPVVHEFLKDFASVSGGASIVYMTTPYSGISSHSIPDCFLEKVKEMELLGRITDQEAWEVHEMVCQSQAEFWGNFNAINV